MGVSHQGPGRRPATAQGYRLHGRRRSVQSLEVGCRPFGRAHPAPGREGQLLGDGRYRPVRALLGSSLSPGRRPALRRGGGGPAVSRPRVRVRPLAGDLEPRLHAVQPRRRRQDDAAAAPVHRHRHGSRAHGGRHAGQAFGLRDRPLRAVDPPHRAAERQVVRARFRARRVDAGHRGSRAHDDLPHCRRRASVQRMARLRAAADHAPRDAPRAQARARRALPLARRGVGGRGDGRRVSGDREGARPDHRGRAAGGRAVRADARPGHAPDRGIRAGAGRRARAADRRPLPVHALRHVRLPPRPRGGDPRRSGLARQRRDGSDVDAGDGGAARARPRQGRLRRRRGGDGGGGPLPADRRQPAAPAAIPRLRDADGAGEDPGHRRRRPPGARSGQRRRDRGDPRPHTGLCGVGRADRRPRHARRPHRPG